MAYSSDSDFIDELSAVQLLHEQRLAEGRKGAGTAAELPPPSLFDPATPPKPKPVPKPKSQLTKVEPKSKPGTIGNYKAAETQRNTSSRILKGLEAGNVTTAKKQIEKITTQEIYKEVIIGKKVKGSHIAYSEVISSSVVGSENSDYVSAVEDIMEKTEPISRRRRLIQKKYLPSSDEDEDEDVTKKTEPIPRRRRLIQKKYLPSSDEDEDEDEDEKRKKPEVLRELRRGFVDLTGSDSEEPSPKSRTEPTISEEEVDDVFVLKYSPPRSSKPCKVIIPEIPAKEPAGRKLSSPTKKAPKIPPSQHRKSSDAFWDQGITNALIDDNTTHKAATDGLWDRGTTEGEEDGILEVEEEVDSEEEGKRPTKHTKPKRPKEKIETKRAFNAQKEQLAEEFFKTIDDKIGDGEVSRKAAATGGVKIIWSNKLRTTAGTAKWKAERLQNVSAQAALEHPMSIERVKHYATIELAEKVVDSREKLYNTMCHEYCHLANYMISYVRKPAHGAEFKRWAAKCSHEFAHLGVFVTTKHSYEIDAKFKWTCQTMECGQIYKRHSKSIDTTRSRCGVCKTGVLLQTHPPLKERPITGYQAFMKENFARIKAQNPGIPQKDVMKIVAQSYRETKVTKLGEAEKDFVETGKEEGDLEALLGGLKV